MSKQKNDQKTRVKMLPVGLAMLMVLVVVGVAVSIGLSSKGSELLRLEKMISEVNTRNREIKMEMVSESSLTKIAQRADQMGMIKPEKVIYLGQGGNRSSLAKAE